MDSIKGLLIAYEVKECEDKVKGLGLFATEDIPKGTMTWQPTTLVQKLSQEEVSARLKLMTKEEAHQFIKQAFVMPGEDDKLCINPKDDGRFTNHSKNPNQYVPEGGKEAFAARDIKAGEELTIDYRGLACPKWYQELCQKYDVMTTDRVVEFDKRRYKV
ncbi:MAG: SET domain-containing protein [Spirulina sp.]